MFTLLSHAKMAAVKIHISWATTVNALSYHHRGPFYNICQDSNRQLRFTTENEAVKQKLFAVVKKKKKICQRSPGMIPSLPELMPPRSAVNGASGGEAQTVIAQSCSLPGDRHRGLFVCSSNGGISVMLTLLFSAEGWSASRCLCFYLPQ